MTTPAQRSSTANRGGRAGADGLAEGIARLRRALRRGARVASPGNSLAVAQLELLSAAAEHPGARPGQLATLLHMRPNTVTTIVNARTAQGMISRATHDTDRRAIELTITDTGQQAVHAWQATNSAVLHLLCPRCPPRSAGPLPQPFLPWTPWPRRSIGSPTPPAHRQGRTPRKQLARPAAPSRRAAASHRRATARPVLARGRGHCGAGGRRAAGSAPQCAVRRRRAARGRNGDRRPGRGPFRSRG
jgi:DNA-binding MarR family transcriptional regulator